jgi:sugar (pentulose or hexulose) kinase
MAEAKFLALDLGAESGRAVVGHFDGKALRLEEIHRFSNGPVLVNGHLYWDALRLLSEVKAGIRLAIQKYGTDVASLGLDTWGVDYGLLDEQDNLLGNPFHYRDSRTDGMMEALFEVVPRKEVFEHTGIQFMQLNTLYQLYAMRQSKSPLLDMAHTFLNMPDLYNFWLTGRKASEFSIATTTQFYDPRRKTWAFEMLEKLDLPTSMLGEIVPPGTVVGDLRADVADELIVDPIPVIAPAGHDTGSAVAAVPAEEQDHAYISSGTWSLMGVEVAEPVITPQSLDYNFTNEGGVCDTFRLLKNIMGLWLVQECRRGWARAGDADPDGRRCAVVWPDRRRRCPSLSRPWGHAGQDPPALPGHGAGRAREQGRGAALRAGKPGPALPLGARQARGRDGALDQGGARHWGRDAERAAVPVCGGRDAAPGGRRPDRGYGDGQHPDAGPGPGAHQLAGSGARGCAQLVPGAHL